MIAEPPGEPYYIARIMEFVYEPEERDIQKTKRRRESKLHSTSAENYMVKVNWFYRPKDISKRSSDSRLLYVTMNSDTCPIASIRGKCTVAHRYHIDDFDLFRKQPDCFWFDKLFDRYILAQFDVVPTEKIINIPVRAQKVLCERFKFAIVESGRAKELCVAPRNCARCDQWCSPDDSVQCAHCFKDYHMICVTPALTKKPSRGFGWSCALCSGARERKLMEQRGIDVHDAQLQVTELPSDTPEPTQTTRSQQLANAFEGKLKSHTLTSEQKHQLKLWPFRYLGVHAKIEDVLDMDDRIYPRAASRLGAKHQCMVSDWSGRPVVYYAASRPEKKKRGRQPANDKLPPKLVSKLNKNLNTSEEIEKLLTLDKKERPSWFQEAPSGYIERGGDETATLMWEMPKDTSIDVEQFLENFAKPLAAAVGVESYTPNFLDSCLKAFLDSDYNTENALEIIKKLNRDKLKEPTLTAKEVKRFENGVRKFGSELHEVYKEVKTKPPADIVRFYYLWKKTPNGHLIWDNFEGRKQKMRPKRPRQEGELVDMVADDNDDSKFDTVKATDLGKSFQCKHCKTTESKIWERAPGFPTVGDETTITALCLRCARLWRRYACVWEEPDEVMKKISFNHLKRTRIEEELYEDTKAILQERAKKRSRSDSNSVSSSRSTRKRSNVVDTKTTKPVSDDSSSKKQHSSTPSPTDSSTVCPTKKRGRRPRPTSKSTGSVPASVKSEGGPQKIIMKIPAKKSRSLSTSSKVINTSESTAHTNSDAVSLGTETTTGLEDTLDLNNSTKSTKPIKFSNAANSSNKKSNLVDSNTKRFTKNTSKKVENGSLHLDKSTDTALVKFVEKDQKGVNDAEILTVNDFSEFYNNTSIPARKTHSNSKDSIVFIPTFSGSFQKPNKSKDPKEDKVPIEDDGKIVVNGFKSVPSIKEYKRSCPVCMTIEPHKDQIRCGKCGMNVHRQCYGVVGEVTSKWICDPCHNEEDPIVKMIYGCILCPIREQRYDACIYGNPDVIPDAVKRTEGNNWAHVKCAIWNQGVGFADFSTLQPITGIDNISPTSQLACYGCSTSKSKGPVTKCACPTCNVAYHIGCAQAKKCLFRILVKASTVSNDHTFIFMGKSVTATPVFVCEESELGPNMLDPQTIDTVTKEPLISLYIQTYKIKKSDSESVVSTSYQPIKTDAFSLLSESTNPKTFAVVEEESSFEKHQCIDCGIDSSPFWWKIENSNERCHRCYWKHKDPEEFQKSYEALTTPLKDFISI